MSSVKKLWIFVAALAFVAFIVVQVASAPYVNAANTNQKQGFQEIIGAGLIIGTEEADAAATSKLTEYKNKYEYGLKLIRSGNLDNDAYLDGIISCNTNARLYNYLAGLSDLFSTGRLPYGFPSKLDDNIIR